MQKNTKNPYRREVAWQAQVCRFTEHICLNCWYRDPKYHGGYCNKYKIDVKPDNSCGSFTYR